MASGEWNLFVFDPTSDATAWAFAGTAVQGQSPPGRARKLDMGRGLLLEVARRGAQGFVAYQHVVTLQTIRFFLDRSTSPASLGVIAEDFPTAMAANFFP